MQEEPIRSKGAKGKASIKKNKEAASRQPEASEGRRGISQQTHAEATGTRDPELIARIRERAYMLFEAAGREPGRDLEHWLEAERQITGSSER